ncbi:alkaline phosphatase family protein [Enterobacter sp. SGAir0187]|uniref:LTA synthase family protein n=1 Tax=Enterobacter sp. SGAir0187 TaxID=2836161 RepID=UPI000CEB798C|nr:alkaline phosphatase family protein [Enterobacter sp. SGAir0187]AVH15923.1 alkaline phosphatase family protein [Enterobacter sp. SGAir0187]
MNVLFKTTSLISNTYRKKSTSSLLDFFLIIIFFGLAIAEIKNPAPLPNYLYSLIHYLWIASPLPLVYIFLRLVKLPSFVSAYIVFLLLKLLEYINGIKLSLTGEVLSWNDLFSQSNITIAKHYLTVWPALLLFLAFSLCVILYFISRKFYTTKKNTLVLAISFITILPFSFYTHFSSLFGEDSIFSRKMILLAKEMNVTYKSWNWSENLQDNGMAMHVVMTSSRKSAPLASKNNKDTYNLEKRAGSAELPKHKTVIYVLCESCWYDNANFKEIITPILNEGFVTFRATSPVYGGGTANVEFEMLTGLPSNSRVLSGIIYQEYATQFKSYTDSIASALGGKGFITYAAHNYLKEFWHRDTVYKKFGFERFDGLYEMSTISLPDRILAARKKWQWQPDDYLLYKSAIEHLKQADGKNIFMNLITMSTHGPYPHENDSGEYIYTFELKQAVDRFVDFYKEVKKIDPNAVVVVYGDHKPALNKFFMNKNVLPSNLFSKTGENDNDFVFKWDIKPTDYGDVPVFVAAGNDKNLERLAQEANNQPYFCVSSLIDKYLINSGLTSFRYNVKNRCSDTSHSYEEKINAMPSWVYSVALFEGDEK